MARQTAVRVTRDAAIAEREGIENLGGKELAAAARRDKSVAVMRGLLPTLAEFRATRDILPLDRAEAVRAITHGADLKDTDNLLDRARSAARLELRGANYGPEERADVAAQIVAAIIEAGDHPAHRASPRLSLTRMCGMAANYRRAIDARRERDQIDADARHAEIAQSSAALGVDNDTPADHAHLLAMSSLAVAEQAASAICRMLGVPDDADSPHWTLLYQWARNESGETCADERGVQYGTWRVRCTRGAKFLRGFWTADALASLLTLGASRSMDGLTLVISDDSREAHTRTRMLADLPTAPHWRQREIAPTDDYSTSRLTRADIVHWTKQRTRRPNRAAETADSLRQLGRALAYAPRRERPVMPHTDGSGPKHGNASVRTVSAPPRAAKTIA